MLGADEPLELIPDIGAADAAGGSIAESVFAILQGILPSAGAQGLTGNPGSYGQEDNASPQSLLDQLKQAQEGEELSGLAPAPKLTVAVRHQETHFKPVIDSMELRAGVKSVDESGVAFDLAATDEAANKAVNMNLSERQGPVKDGRSQISPLHLAQTPASPGHQDQPEEAVSFSSALQGLEVSDEQSDVRHPASVKIVSQNEAHGLPSETLHRIASAIKSDLLAAAESAPQVKGTAQTISIKPSDSVLRILNLQLHPADLGAVTIKMKLAGDGLEMELHVEREETAQLLRSDTEKLSSLLRGSGYRPDTISIHVSDVILQDRTATTRAQSDMQMQGQSFQHGGTSQDERPRNRERHYANAGAEHQQKHEDDKTVDGHSSGGVYL